MKVFSNCPYISFCMASKLRSRARFSNSNLNKIREIEPWFNNTYILRLKDLDFEVPVSRSKVKEFRQLMHL